MPPSRLALPRVCVALGFSDPSTLMAHARLEAESGETFLEFRLDYLPDPLQGIAMMREFLHHHPECRILATCRRQPNYGRFTGTVEEQFRLLHAAIDAGAVAVDVEIETAEIAQSQIASLNERATLIVSYHHFDSTPALAAIMRRMLKVKADGYKIVTTARKPTDMSRLLALAKSHPRTPLILLSMGEVGFPSRVLSTTYNSLFTYAAPQSSDGTAPGQMSARLMRQIYHVDKLSKSTKIYGVIAEPVRHSLSPVIHNRAFQAKRLDSVYLPFLVSPTQLRDFFTFANAVSLAGGSVTIPHKQKVMRYLDYIDPLARRIGAVNTVWKKAGKWRGANTDVFGITVPLRRHLRLNKSSVLIVGSGGAARGAAFALADAGAKVSITGRTPAHVQQLAKASGAEALTLEQAVAQHFDALVQSTPVGMHPNVDATFFPGIIPADLVFDMVYNPLETRLIREAKAQGKKVIPGLEMFIEQAAHQFETWTGEQAPRPVMERAALDALTSRRDVAHVENMPDRFAIDRD